MKDSQIWAEIDLAACAHNVSELKRMTRQGTLLMAVVKANAYGHGAVEVAHAAIRGGADWLGVARLHEALELRSAGIGRPILIFGFTPPERVGDLLANDLTQAVFSFPMAEALAEGSTRLGATLRVHIKIDTGMGRLGLLAPATRRLAEVEAIAGLRGLELEGIFTHFATADSADKTYALQQLQRFSELVDSLSVHGLEFPLRHAANSAALIDLPAAHFDLVRPGIATYGLYPSPEVQRQRVELRPVLAWKTRIIQLKKVPAGFGVSYGMTYRTPHPTTLATVAVGYADGYPRALSSRGRMLLGGRAVPVVGRVCMDLTLLDVGEVPGIAVGDEVVILGRQGDVELTADQMATELDTINYEIVTGITARVPRIYLR